MQPPLASAPDAPAATTRRILGIDPGLRSTGYGIVTHTRRGLQYLASGCIKSPQNGGLPTRLKTILLDLAEVIATFQPTEVAIEIVFVNVKPQSTLLLGQARGAAISAAVLAELPVAEYTALQIKQAVAGHGKAAKEQVQEMVRRLLALPSAPGADASDALACAICHAHAGESYGGLRRSGFRVRAGRIL
jgi:crossover junction endodeoxyribonuclease RuvC